MKHSKGLQHIFIFLNMSYFLALQSFPSGSILQTSDLFVTSSHERMVVRTTPSAHLCGYAGSRGFCTLLVLVSEQHLMVSAGHTGRVTQMMTGRTTVKGASITCTISFGFNASGLPCL